MKLLTTNGDLIHQGDFKNIKELVEYCVKNKISLEAADLRGANLVNTYFKHCTFNKSSFNKSSFKGSKRYGSVFRPSKYFI